MGDYSLKVRLICQFVVGKCTNVISCAIYGLRCGDFTAVITRLDLSQKASLFKVSVQDFAAGVTAMGIFHLTEMIGKIRNSKQAIIYFWILDYAIFCSLYC